MESGKNNDKNNDINNSKKKKKIEKIYINLEKNAIYQYKISV